MQDSIQVGTLGFYEFNLMPFGLCNAPAPFQRLMERSMGDMNLRDCLIYLDNIVVFSSTFEEHLERLEAVFQRLNLRHLSANSLNRSAHTWDMLSLSKESALILLRSKQYTTGQYPEM